MTNEPVAWGHPEDSDPPRHIGVCLGVLDDGRVPQYRRGQVWMERQFTDDPAGPGGTWAGPDAATLPPPVALQPGCTCGWIGPRVAYEPTDKPNHPDGERWDGAGDAVRREWMFGHANPAIRARPPQDYRERLAQLAAPLGELADERPRAALTIARQLRDIADHIEVLGVVEAQAHRVPWEEIGADLGQSRQAVHRRYSKPSQELTRRVQELTGEDVESLLISARHRRPGARPAGRYWHPMVWRILGADAPPTQDDQPRP